MASVTKDDLNMDEIEDEEPGCISRFCEETYYYFFHYFFQRNFFYNIETALVNVYQVDCNRGDRKKRTPLHYMCLDNRVNTLKLLLVDHHINTDINALDSQGRTPLHYACRNGNEECAILLLKLGADPTIRDKHNWTPFDAARFNGHREFLNHFKGNIKPGILSPTKKSTTPAVFSPSRPIQMGDLTKDLPPEHTELGVQMDDIFIPSPALQRRRFKDAGAAITAANRLKSGAKGGDGVSTTSAAGSSGRPESTQFASSNDLD